MGIRGQLTALTLGGTGTLFIIGLLFAADAGSLRAYMFTGAVAIAAAAVAAMLVGRRYVYRLGRLHAVAAQFADGAAAANISDDADDEITQLGAALDRMAGRLEQESARFIEIDRVKSEFVSSVSHELRTPLTTIKALTRLLMRGELSEVKRREYLETISVECDRQIDLVLNLLDLSRIEGGVFRIVREKVDVVSVIESCIKSESIAAEKRGHTLTVGSLDSAPSVCADSKALRRVLSNLIENAIKYTPDGGLITVASTNDGGNVAISVTDSGSGIPPEDIPRLFDKFHRGRANQQAGTADSTAADEDFLSDAEASGVGLGLYLARNVITQMGGTISVDTELGRGSIFTLRLPKWENGDC